MKNITRAPGAQPQPEHETGFCTLPKKLRTDLARLKRDGVIDGNAFIMAIYFADLTIGWQSRFVSLSRSEMVDGKSLPNGLV